MNTIRTALCALLFASLACAQAPVDRPQPNQASFAVSELQQFPTYTRDAYRAKFGAPAPACDPNRPIKAWFDRTVDLTEPSNVAIYRVVAQDAKGAFVLKQLVLTNADAAALNLPGREVFPSYTPAPTPASVLNSLTGAFVSGIEPVLLSTKEQATAYAARFNGSIEEELRGGLFPYFYPATESRRMWVVIDAAGNRYYAGQLVAYENGSGIGAPGSWIQSPDTGRWVWRSDQVSDCANKSDSVPVPVRALLPNELLSGTLMGPQVIRTDKQLAVDQAAGSFTAEDRALLRAIAAKLGIQ